MEKNILISVIAAVNDILVLDSNLKKSPLLRDPDVEFIPASGFDNISSAYNHGVRLAKGQFLIFVHQDVYIPKNWRNDFENALQKIKSNWGVIGLVGIDLSGEVVGRCWSTGLKKEVGTKEKEPCVVNSVDELLFIVNPKKKLFFDENLPGWHLYGTDIVQTARNLNYLSYVIDAPVIHNSLPVIKFDKNFCDCYFFLRKKWRKSLPITTCCTKITFTSMPLIKRFAKQTFKTGDREMYTRLQDPRKKAIECGYEVAE